MRQANSSARSTSLPKPVLELCARLEEHGLRTFSHGEGLLSDLRTGAGSAEAGDPGSIGARIRSDSLLCQSTPRELLRALPRAVVTAEGALRVTQATKSGPVDVVCCGPDPIEETLLTFGLGPFGLAYRPANDSWIDPKNQLAAISAGRLELLTDEPNPFLVAPRRYWIAARLIAENGLEATAECLEAAIQALPTVGDRLPQAAPARREVTRILDSPHPASGLAFLRESGVGSLLFPGTKATNEERIAQLPKLPSLRWAAWLRGSATARVLVRFRAPHDFARRVERIQAHHPIERVVDAAREHGIRKIMQRLAPEEIAALLAWRRLELAAARNPAEAQEIEAHLVSIEMRIAEARATESRASRIRALALDGEAVMKVLDAGPGRHVGQALTHLAHFVEGRPERNDPTALEAELLDWARKNTSLLD